VVILCDVNVLVYGFHEDSPDHARYTRWLGEMVGSDLAFGVSELVLSGVIRIATHPRIFDRPAPVEEAVAFAEALQSAPNSVTVRPGPRHWDIFSRLCMQTGARGGVVADAYHAAFAIESGSQWITADRGFARFPGLSWRHPFADGVA